jgi:glucose-6-phosphate 1-dehydrogenase
MQHWKFLLVGITGDLSKRKILPGLAQFAELNKENVSVDLIGYSRSQPDSLEIEDILNKHTSDARHNVSSLKYVQGEYSDSTYFSQLIHSLKEGERLIVYIATPPVVFLQLLETFCPFNAYNLDIIIEKPFGQNLEEAHAIMKKIDSCRLNKNVHFCDHYLFKNAAYLPVDVLHALQDVKRKKVSKITVQALEELDAKGRGGYYDTNGAIKDMLPAHIYSLLGLGMATFTQTDTKDHNNFTIKEVILGQYESYLADVEKDTSVTETYFKIHCLNSIEIILESGKNLGQKRTAITINFEDGSELAWNIDPEKTLSYTNSNKQLVFDISKNGKLDHTNMFEDLLHGKSDRFFIAQNVLSGWEMYEKVQDYIRSKSISNTLYRDGTWPITKI